MRLHICIISFLTYASTDTVKKCKEKENSQLLNVQNLPKYCESETLSTTIPGYKDLRNKLRLKRRKKMSDQKKNEIPEQLASITLGSKNSYPVSKCVLRS